MRVILAGLATAVLVAALGGVTAAQDAKIDVKLLVGKWVPEDKAKDFVVEFTKDGKVKFARGDLKADGTYKLDGNKLSLMMKFGDEEKNQVRVISKLTKTELVSSDESSSKEDTLVRVPDKK